jgi:hypothetical protein
VRPSLVAKGRRVRFIMPDEDPSDMNAVLLQRGWHVIDHHQPKAV